MDIIYNWRYNLDKHSLGNRVHSRDFMHDRDVSFVGLISGVVAWIFDWGFEAGFHVGIYIGVALYALYCIGRIINPEITIEFYTDGSNKVLSERWNGIIGLIVLIGACLLAIFG